MRAALLFILLTGTAAAQEEKIVLKDGTARDKAMQRITHSRDTGKVMTTDYADKGIVKGKPKKKAERKKSVGLY